MGVLTEGTMRDVRAAIVALNDLHASHNIFIRNEFLVDDDGEWHRFEFDHDLDEYRVIE